MVVLRLFYGCSMVAHSLLDDFLMVLTSAVIEIACCTRLIEFSYP